VTTTATDVRPDGQPTVLLLERPGPTPRPFDRPTATPPGRPAAAVPATGTATTDPALRSPALALLASLAVLEGYRWLGVIPTGASRLSGVVFGRPGAVAFAAIAGTAALGMARARPEARNASHRLFGLATVALVTATVLLVASGGSAAQRALGVADLALAAVCAGAVAVGEYRRIRSDSSAAGRRSGTGARRAPVT
jgi:hypothetical protein